jgi:hypothetical protein
VTPGSNEWWDALRSQPFLEQDRWLRNYRADLLEANGGKTTHMEASHQVHRINNELHRLTQLINRTTLKQAMRNVLPPEQCELVVAEAARLEHFARLDPP